MITVPVKASRAYDICIGRGLLEQSGTYLRRVTKGDTIMLVCGDIVAKLHAPRVKASLEASGYRVEQFIYPHGEQSKTIDTYFRLQMALAEAGLTRSDTIVALGGGVTGDLAGFAAATYQRGIAYVQMPTTLLAAVDSSVGGKTAIDLPAGKNLVGAFYQPRLVLCDLDALDTLPPEIFTEGMAEVIKYGVIWDEVFFDRLSAGIGGGLEDIISRCVSIKAEVVAQDEYDRGLRGLLNFGHTAAHAIEQLSHYAVPHGNAVAIGMVLVTKAAQLAGLCTEDVFTRVLQLVRQYGLPEKTDFAPRDVVKAMYADKKRAGDSITLVVPRALGRCELRTMTTQEMEDFFLPALEDQPWT